MDNENALMKYYKAFLSFLFIVSVYGCENNNKLNSRGFVVRTSEDSTLDIRHDNYHISIAQTPIADEAFLVHLIDSTRTLFFETKNETGEWNFVMLKNNELEGKLLKFDQYQAVTSISWFHDGECFLTITPNALVSFSDSKKIKVDHILPPHIIVRQDSLRYYFTIEQKSYPIVSSICRSNRKINNFKDDLISNTRSFSVKSDSLPITINIDYSIDDLTNYTKLGKSYQWSSATDSVIELKVDQ